MKQNQTAKEIIVTKINRINNTSIVAEDVDIKLLRVNEDGSIVLLITSIYDASDKIEITSRRSPLTVFFGIEQAFIDYSSMESIEDLSYVIKTQLGFVVEEDEVTLSISEDDQTITLTATESSILYEGSMTLSLRPVGFLMGRSIALTLDSLTTLKDNGKFPINRYYKQKGSLRLTGFRVKELLSAPRVIDTADHPIVKLLQELTGDLWVAEDRMVDFNLHGTVIDYHGPNTGLHYNKYAADSHVIVFTLGDNCRNLQGTLSLGYKSEHHKRFQNLLVGNTIPSTIIFS